ncbi:hypothetical protein EGW08_000859 [Elysia chlorotica]|uniref:G-protein coupled receptors family 1 profile domain-containing protein n=1 Tax=Elysia chlorotica TaxID=188477 RepID=A0A3S1I358_ELYCH|nr:hypothetical protein EGW08_000859 [Elysia chlorotica]
MYVLPHPTQSGDTMTPVSADHIKLTPTQSVGDQFVWARTAGLQRRWAAKRVYHSEKSQSVSVASYTLKDYVQVKTMGLLELNNSDNASLEELLALYQTYDGATYLNNIILMIVYVPVFLVAVLGNILVLLVIFGDVKAAKNSANWFLVNLALADLLVAIFCIPITAVHYVFNVWVLGTNLCKVTAYMQGVSIVTSVLTIVLMSVDRYLAIRHPMKNRRIFTLSRVRRLVMMTWLTAAVVVFPIALVSEVSRPFGVQHDYCTEIWPSHLMRQVYDVAFLVCIYLIPGGAIVVLYTLVGFRLWAKDAHLQRQNSIRNQDDVLLVRRRLALMMIIISILFAACWLPYYICNICLDFEMEMNNQLIDLYPFAILLGHSNSAQNPILYCIMHKGFKNFLLKIIKCHCRKIRWRRQNTSTNSFSYNGSLRSPSYKMVGRNSPSVRQSEIIMCKELSGSRGSRHGRTSFRCHDV